MDFLLMFFMFFISPILCLAIGCFIIFVTLRVNKVFKGLDQHRQSQERHEKIALAQLSLLASIADKTGVPMSDINDVTKQFDIEFE